MLGYAIILYGFLSDVIVFNEEIQALQLIGALIIFAVTFIVAVVKLCEQHRERRKLLTQVSTPGAEAEEDEASAAGTARPLVNDGDAAAEVEMTSTRDKRQVQR